MNHAVTWQTLNLMENKDTFSSKLYFLCVGSHLSLMSPIIKKDQKNCRKPVAIKRKERFGLSTESQQELLSSLWK